MIRLLVVLVIVAVAAMLLVKDKSGHKPEIIYQQNLDEAKELEQKMLDDARRRMEEVDGPSR
jgi:type II secretory pathway pseudopilin PulG